jgi:hypothetical protein
MVGRGDYGPQRDAFCLHHHRAFDASFSPIHRASSRFLSTARSFGYAPVHRQIGQLQPDETVVSFEHDLPEGFHQPEADPLVAPSLRSVLSEQDSSAILQ